MNVESLLSKSLVSASTLRSGNSHSSLLREDSSSESSSSSESERTDESDMSKTLSLNSLKLSHRLYDLQLKLERQLSKQNKIAERSRAINKNIKTLSRQIITLSKALIDRTSEENTQPTNVFSTSSLSSALKSNNTPSTDKHRPKSTAALAKRTIPFTDEDVRGKHKTPKITDSPVKITSSINESPRMRPVFAQSSTRRSPMNSMDRLKLASLPSMDIYRVKEKNGEVCFHKKPRSVLFNDISSDINLNLSELMITTSLDGELQFWDTRSRRIIKRLGKDILFDSWVDEICWINHFTLALIPAQKSGMKTEESVELIHLGDISKNNVEGRTQRLKDMPHENGISTIAPVNTQTNACSFVTGGYDKSVYLWDLSRTHSIDNYVSKPPCRLSIKHTSAVYSLSYDKYHNLLYSGGSDAKLGVYDTETSSVIKEIRCTQRVSQITQSKSNPNMHLLTLTQRSDQFLIYDNRMKNDIQLKFGQLEEETLSRYVRPDMHENGYMVSCGSQSSSRINFWDIRYIGVSDSASFHMETTGSSRILRSGFVPYQNTIVALSSTRHLSWLDYDIHPDQIVKTL